MKILILEDDPDRRSAMLRCLQDRFHQYEIRFFDNVLEMIQFLNGNLDQTIVLCLDHDLDLKPGQNGNVTDPGTGREIADHLARRSPVCPVVIHTTNSSAAIGMEEVLQSAGWETFRVIPFDDLEWISTEWFRTVRRAIVGSAKKSVSNPT